MKTHDIIDTMTTKVKTILQNHIDQLDKPLTAENAEKVIEIIGLATNQAAAEGLKTYLEAAECTENSVMHNGENYLFNRNSNKEFQTTFGKIVLKRRLYRNEKETQKETPGTNRSVPNCWRSTTERRRFIVRYCIFKRMTMTRRIARSRWGVRRRFSATIRTGWTTDVFASTAGRSGAG